MAASVQNGKRRGGAARPVAEVSALAELAARRESAAEKSEHPMNGSRKPVSKSGRAAEPVNGADAGGVEIGPSPILSLGVAELPTAELPEANDGAAPVDLLGSRVGALGDLSPIQPSEMSVVEPQAKFRSYLDEVSDTEISGWIIQPDQPSERCVVALKEGERVLARTVASLFRSDLASAGVGDGCHAFNLAMPRALLDGEEHLLEIIEEDSGFPLTAEPVRWRSAAGTAGAALTGLAGDPAIADLDDETSLRTSNQSRSQP